MNKSLVTLALTTALASSIAVAGVIPPSSTYNLVTADSKTNTNAYVGLNWTLGNGATPALVLGVANTKVKSNGNTEGANLSFQLNLAGGIKPGPLKLSYLNGKNNLQGEAGVGYNFLNGSPLLSLGANAPYIAAGVDGYLNGNILPYATLHSQGKFKKPTKQECVLASGLTGTFFDSTCQTLPPA